MGRGRLNLISTLPLSLKAVGWPVAKHRCPVSQLVALRFHVYPFKLPRQI